MLQLWEKFHLSLLSFHFIILACFSWGELWQYVLIWKAAEGVVFCFSILISFIYISLIYFPVVWQGDNLHVSCYYIDCNLNAYAISSAQVSMIHLSQNMLHELSFCQTIAFLTLIGILRRILIRMRLNLW